MNKLITLTGDSGCGKTHLMRLMLENYKEDLYSLTLNFRKENEEFVLEEE